MKFTGHERDLGVTTSTADDLDYMHARFYNPQVGRFLSVDPVNSAKQRTPQSWNRYAYAFGNPIKYVDPDGKESLAALQFEMDAQAVLHGDMSSEEFQERNMARAQGALTGLSILGDVGLARAALRGVVGLFRGFQVARAAGFASRQLLVKHFEEHGAEFGAKTVKEYLKQAQSFVRQEGLESVTRANGDKLLYDAAKNEFAVVAKDGAIRTYFKPRQGLGYWLDQVKKALKQAV